MKDVFNRCFEGGELKETKTQIEGSHHGSIPIDAVVEWVLDIVRIRG